ncbi:DUF6665 family protein [Tianweitania sediminis]|jgi:hypothetical protein|uniref:Uncharacterized protein n=1 Tax=Tianweitania sediminis TaxID=1502156 RepID=A0A8J7RJ34_9HYPH|nr:DUF6665 family protein [Tianweitania sediminis]MBP0439376.1 hypothetical protein [Tianweitania sediminis]HEV7415976.1 DUF6665 family protein [Tianweitania sediminis]
MSLRLPSFTGSASAGDVLFDALNAEVASEKASALGHAGEKAAKALAELASASSKELRYPALLKAASDAVYALFIQRELCGMRRHDAVIRDLRIPNAVLARLGAG